jgi:hypothetical protein
MTGRVLRCVVLSSSLLLALPPGWCCFLVFQPTKPTESQSKAKGADCARCCAHQTPQPDPTDKPFPPPPGRCPCTDRLTVLPKSATVDRTDLVFAFAATLAVPLSFAVSEGIPADAIWSAHPPAHPPHLLNCVWLC